MSRHLRVEPAGDLLVQWQTCSQGVLASTPRDRQGPCVALICLDTAMLPPRVMRADLKNLAVVCEANAVRRRLLHVPAFKVEVQVVLVFEGLATDPACPCATSLTCPVALLLLLMLSIQIHRWLEGATQWPFLPSLLCCNLQHLGVEFFPYRPRHSPRAIMLQRSPCLDLWLGSDRLHGLKTDHCSTRKELEAHVGVSSQAGSCKRLARR
mmetsp:Transcript_15703/g.42811  ORF Transcript_15703/g.42811 Transcript_15703/m.42811 type:complete len:210 (+) Transcript_15703:389-1018(+)